MPSNAYLFETGHLFASSTIELTVTMRAYAMVLLTANGKKFSMSGSGAKGKYQIAIIRPGGRYKINADEIPFVAALVNPLHPQFAAFRSIESRSPCCPPRTAFASLNRALNAAVTGELPFAQTKRLFDRIVTISLQHIAPSPALDSRVAKALSLLNRRGNQSMTKLAKSVGLSYFRLSHLFTQSIGISLRNYLLWQKIHGIPFLHSKGATLAQIAKHTGFTDAAHFTHTFREVFGAPPSYFLAGDSVRVTSWMDSARRRTTSRSR